MWTDGNADQFGLSKAVKRWFLFRDTLLDTSSYNIVKKNWGIVLLFSLHGCARDVCERIADQTLAAIELSPGIASSLPKGTY